VIDRCAVIAVPWQTGKVDQGILTFWMLAHHFGRPPSYIAFGGEGNQVRDLRHVEAELLDEQLRTEARGDEDLNVGARVQPVETTELCRKLIGRTSTWPACPNAPR
jgi:CDP-paratose 2-epimerase